jgi:hypothetical protein
MNTEALAALERFVVENDDLLALESLIGRFNIFDALGIKDAEIRHSNFLAFILDPAESHGQGQLFLKAVLMDLLKAAGQEFRPLSPIELDGADLRGVEVRREWQHIDLLIICQEPRLLVVIENKIRSSEGADQLSRYERVMQEQYPDARPLYVYLTVEGDPPSQERWMPYAHADIHRVLTRVREANGNAIGDDVLVFLNHYLTLLGTRFMNDEKLDDLCRRIYKNHRQALDLIWERMGTPTSGVLGEAKQVLDEDSKWSVDARPGCILFMPSAWLAWLPKLGDRGDRQRWIYCVLGARNGRLRFCVDVAPMTDPTKRKEMVKQLLDVCPTLGFKLPRGAATKEVRNIYSRVTAAEEFGTWDEDDYDLEAIRDAVKKMLEGLSPKLDKLERVLKQLCNVPESAT